MPTIEELVNQSGILTNINLPGINHVKEQVIQNYVNSLILGQSLDIHQAQIFNKDLGNDIRISVYYNGELFTPINYSQLNIPA
ncbi:MAG TPA: hypothetical protein VLB84_02725 [Bacteroidia bacterium]|nr:hypothetical protein [Bacteroidia bacterium]